MKRKLRISVSDPDKIWNSFYQKCFSKIEFQIPFFVTNKEQNENDLSIDVTFSYHFINEDESNNFENKIGSDPFVSTFFYIRCQKLTNDKEKIRSLQKWCENAINNEKPWCVFLYQEKVLFGSNANSNPIPQLIPSERQFIHQGKLQMNDIQFETMKNKFNKLVLDSIMNFTQIARDCIQNESFKKNVRDKFKVWYSLLLFYFGSFKCALNGFKEIYNEYIQYNLKTSIIPPLESFWITKYPYLNGDDKISIFIFALSGCLSSYFFLKKSSNLVETFLHCLAILKSKKINKKVILNWENQSLEGILDIENDFLNSNQYQQLLFQLFQIKLKIGIPRHIDEVYHKLTNQLNDRKYMITAANILYSNYEICNEVTNNWPFGFKAAQKFIDEALKQQKYSKLRYYASSLFSDRVPIEIKNKLFETCISLDSEVVIDSPFICKFELASEAFQSHVKICYPFEVTVKFRFKYYFTKENHNATTSNAYDSAILYLRKGDIVKDFEINSSFYLTEIKFLIYLKESGIWDFDKIEVQKGALIFSWPIKTEYHIYVDEYQKPTINISYPKFIEVDQIPLSFSVDIETLIKYKSIAFIFNFIDPESYKIPDQKGQAVDGETLFEITNSILTLSNINYHSSKIEIIIYCQRINYVENTALEVFLHESSNLNNIDEDNCIHKFETNISIKFPIQCTIRFLNEKFVQLCIKNISNFSFIIEKAELSQKIWSRQSIDPGEDIYFLSNRCGDDIFTMSIKDEKGMSISMSWDVKDPQLQKYIELNLFKKKNFIVGEAFKVMITLPQCKYKFSKSKDMIVVGKVKSKNFIGGEISFSFIPLAFGNIKLPTIFINNTEYFMQPEYLKVTQANSNTYSPLF